MKKYIETTVELIQDVQRIYGQRDKTGLFKKQRVKDFFENQLVKLSLCESYEEMEILQNFVDYYLDPLIDSVVFIAKSKAINKLFKSKCSMCVPF